MVAALGSFSRSVAAVVTITLGCLWATSLLRTQRGCVFLGGEQVVFTELRGAQTPRGPRPLQLCAGEQYTTAAASRGESSASSGACLAAGVALGAAALLGLRSASRVAMRGAGTYDRKWRHIEETRDPTTLPVWQRDYRYGFQLLKMTMHESRKKGKKVFWEVRVLESKELGCKVEMMKSGLIGWCPVSQEGPTRLNVGDIVKMECIAAPKNRVNRERKNSPWPMTPRHYKAEPVFSHWHWLEQQKSIKKAKDLCTGDIVEGTVVKHIAKGLLIDLDGDNGAKGMLDMMDISRKCSSHIYVDKMFPPGTKMRCYVVHADTENGRITLSTKEFEDDDHMGWMLSFPERCMARAEIGVERFAEKREGYIRLLQR